VIVSPPGRLIVVILNARQYLHFTRGDELIIQDIWVAMVYKGEGYFIAGGAGITPVIAILRQLKKENRVANYNLYFSNRTEADIIYHDELDEILEKNAHYIVTDKVR
jgi:ferredoxin-NADP reductase